MKVQKGFTLVEAAAVMAVIGITLAVGVPYYKKAVGYNRLAAQVNGFIALMNYARSSAITRNGRVSVCPKNAAGKACDVDWRNGALAFVDANANGAVDGGEEILRMSGTIDGGNTFSATKQGTANVVTVAGYLSSGTSAVTDSAVNFTLCDPVLHISRTLTLTVVGQFKSVQGQC
jgi:type IV fimbrial biogenesis protein FimT